MSSCFGYQKRSPFWELVLVPCAHILCFQLTICEGTMFGHNFGNHFWSPFWEPIFCCGVQSLAALGISPRTFRHPVLVAMMSKQPTHRGAPNRTQQRARIGRLGVLLCSTWRAAPHLFFPSQRHFTNFGDRNVFPKRCHLLAHQNPA